MFLPTAAEQLLAARNDTIGDLVRQRHTLRLVSEVLVGAWDEQAPEWWRDRADRVDQLGDRELAAQLRRIACLIEEARL